MTAIIFKFWYQKQLHVLTSLCLVYSSGLFFCVLAVYDFIKHLFNLTLVLAHTHRKTQLFTLAHSYNLSPSQVQLFKFWIASSSSSSRSSKIKVLVLQNIILDLYNQNSCLTLVVRLLLFFLFYCCFKDWFTFKIHDHSWRWWCL